MKLLRNTVAVCLLIMVCLALPAQKNSQQDRKVVPQPAVTPIPAPDTCAKPTYHQCVDICALAAKLDSQNRPIRLRSLRNENEISLAEHNDVTLYANQDQIVWICREPGHTFKIRDIQRVIKLPGKNPFSPKPMPESPFCIDVTSLPETKSGETLSSGTAKQSAIGQMYKYSFTVTDTGKTPPNPRLYDPHLGVADGTGIRRRWQPGCSSLPRSNQTNKERTKSKK